MSQTVVNFIIDNPTVIGFNPITEPRIFDFEIDDDAKAFYISQMSQLRSILENLSSPLVGSDLPQVETISTIINTLNDWSKLRVVATVPIIDKGTGLIAGTTTTQTYLVNGNAMPVDLDGNVVTVQFTGSTMNVDSSGRVTILPQAPPTFTSGATTLTSTMDRYMAEEFDKLLRTFRAAGWDPVFTPFTGLPNPATPDIAAALDKITGPSREVFGVLDVGTSKGILSRAIDVANQARIIGQSAATQSESIQQVLMVDYISRGNELLFNEMSKLRDAIDTNQSVLQYLNSLQDLMNQKDPERFILQLQHLNNILAAVNPQAQYDQFETESYNQALGTVSRITSDDPTAIQKFLTTAAGTDLGHVQFLINLKSTSAAQVESSIQSLLPVTFRDGLSDADTLAITHLAQQIALLNQSAPPNTWLGFTFVQLSDPAVVLGALTTAASGVVPPADTFFNGSLFPLIQPLLANSFQENLSSNFIGNKSSPISLISTAINITPGGAAALTEAAERVFRALGVTAATATPLDISVANAIAIRLALHNYDLSPIISGPLPIPGAEELGSFDPVDLANVLQQISIDLEGPGFDAFINAAGIAYLNSKIPLMAQNLAVENSNSLYGTLFALTGAPVSSLTSDQYLALGSYAKLLAAANTAGNLPGLLSTNPTTVQAALTTLLPAVGGDITAAGLTYLTGILPTVAQGIAANNVANAGSPDTPPARQTFAELSNSLQKIFTYSRQQITDNLDFLMGQIAAKGGNAGQPLSIALTKIKQDFLNVTSIKEWIEDTDAGTEGDFQRHLNDGLVASQSFNDTQREELSRVMFVFEEFYKSATGLLSRLTQLIEKMATAIAR